MMKTVLITGAGGNLGAKVRAHFAGLGWTLRLLDVDAKGDAGITPCDLAVWDEGWVRAFAGVDCVIHLAGDPRSFADWPSVQRLNIDLFQNVYEAAARRGVK